MAELDIFEGEVPKKWFDFGGDSEVELLYMGKEVLTKIAKKAAEIASKTKALDQSVTLLLIGRYSVKGWRLKADHSHPGLTIGGKPIEFTPQNLDMLMRLSTDFSTFVNNTASDADKFRTTDEMKIDKLAAELFGHHDEDLNDSKNG